MKNFYLIALLVLTINLRAQVANYTFTQETGGTYSNGSNLLGWNYEYDSNSNETYTVNLGFTFYFDNQAFTSISVNSNGFIKFAGSQVYGTNVLATTSSSSIVAAFNTTLKARAKLVNGIWTTEGRFGYSTSGSAPNRSITITWSNYTNGNTDDNTISINFAIKLYETSNVIEFIYGNMSGYASNVQVGLRGTSTSDFNIRTTTSNWASTTLASSNSATCSFSTNIKPVSGTIFRYTPPTVTCDVPQNIQVSNILDSSAQLTWENSTTNSANNFQYIIQPAGTGVPAGAGTLVTNANTFVLSNLSPETDYEVYIRKMCTFGKTSSWSGPYNFTTLPSTMSVSNSDRISFNIYPNPVTNTVYINSAEQIKTIIIYDVMGHKLKEKIVDAKEVVLDCSTLPPGTYLAQIQTAHATSTKKIIKQ